MKNKKTLKFKLLALFILIAMLLPMTLACGDKPADAGSDAGNGAAGDDAGEPAGEDKPPPTDPLPTDPPPPTEPPPTEPPTEPFEVDASLSYWDQIYSELEWYGLSGGVMIFNADNIDADPDEFGLMRRFSTNNMRREELDVSGDGVPFAAAYHVYNTREVPNFWEAGYSAAFKRDIETNADDIVAGVIWIRGKRTEDSPEYMADAGDPAEFYMAIKTPTDEWASEGSIEPFGIQMAEEDEWERIMWTGRVVNDEVQSSTMGFNIYTGYGLQSFDIGGIVAWVFPSNSDNEKAASKIHY